MQPDINLLPKYERQSSFISIIFISAFVIWLLITALLIYQYVSTKSSLKQVNTQVEQLTEKKTNLEQEVAAMQSVERASLASAVEYAESVTFPTSRLIDNLINSLPEHAYFSNYDYNEGEIKIQSQFETMDVAADYVAKLVASDYINDVKIEKVEAFDIEDSDQISFNTVPRYDVTQLLQANIEKLKEEADSDE